MLMIWSSRARNRSFDPVVLCFFGRIVPPMHHRIMVHSERESKNEIARFGALKLPIPAISNASASEKQTPAQSLRALFTDDLLDEGYRPLLTSRLGRMGFQDVERVGKQYA